MIKTWSDISRIETTINAIAEASGAVARVGSIVDLDDVDTGEALGDVMSANAAALRALRAWVDKARTAREAADFERKKAGLA